MAVGDPVIVSCPADTWTKVADDAWLGRINKLYDDDIADPTGYLYTYRITGELPPTLKTEGVLCFLNGNTEWIISWWGIDVYIWAIERNGQVRVDLS